MWLWGTIFVVVAVVVAMVIIVDRRRGSTGASRSLDVKMNNRARDQHDGGIHGPTSGGGDGGG